MSTGNNFINLVVILKPVTVNISSPFDVAPSKILFSVEYNAGQERLVSRY